MAQGALALLAPRGTRQKPRAFREGRGPFARSRAPGLRPSRNRGQDAAVVPTCIPVDPRLIPVHHRKPFPCLGAGRLGPRQAEAKAQ